MKNFKFRLDIVKEYLNNGHNYEDINYHTAYKDYPIGVWLSWWRGNYKCGKLSKTNEQELRNLGEQFLDTNYKTDLEKIDIIKEYISLGNNYNDIIQSTRYNDNWIGNWVNTWRVKYKKGTLDKKTEEMLKEIGETFEAKNSPRLTDLEKISILQRYVDMGYEYNEIVITTVYIYEGINYPIGVWRKNFRSQYKRKEIDYHTEQSLRLLGETFLPKKKLRVNPNIQDILPCNLQKTHMEISTKRR